MSVPIRTYSQQLIEGFSKNGLQRLEALSENDLSSVVYWLESKKMELAMQVAIEDDPLQAAKYRGGIEHLDLAAYEVLEVLKQRLEAKEEQDDAGTQ